MFRKQDNYYDMDMLELENCLKDDFRNSDGLPSPKASHNLKGASFQFSSQAYAKKAYRHLSRYLGPSCEGCTLGISSNSATLIIPKETAKHLLQLYRLEDFFRRDFEQGCKSGRIKNVTIKDMTNFSFVNGVNFPAKFIELVFDDEACAKAACQHLRRQVSANKERIQPDKKTLLISSNAADELLKFYRSLKKDVTQSSSGSHLVSSPKPRQATLIAQASQEAKQQKIKKQQKGKAAKPKEEKQLKREPQNQAALLGAFVPRVGDSKRSSGGASVPKRVDVKALRAVLNTYYSKSFLGFLGRNGFFCVDKYRGTEMCNLAEYVEGLERSSSLRLVSQDEITKIMGGRIVGFFGNTNRNDNDFKNTGTFEIAQRLEELFKP